MKTTPTVSDVAREAGVSTATVSRAMNGDTRVIPETRDKVKQAAEKIGYIFNDTARSLKTRKSRTIGFICPELSNNFLMEIAEGIEAVLNQKGYHLLLRHSQSDPAVESQAIEEFLSRRVDGLIMVPADETRMPAILNRRQDIPRLTVDRKWQNQNFPAVLTDNRISSRDALIEFNKNHAFEKNPHAFWGIVTGPSYISTSRERKAGFEDAMNILGINNWIDEMDSFDASGGYRAMKHIFQTHQDIFNSPDTKLNLFAANYFMHQGVTEFLLEKNIPLEKVGICAFDYSPLHRLFQYASLFINQPHLEMGSRAVEILMELLDHSNSDQDVLLKNQLIGG